MPTETEKIFLGDEVKCRITGFKGTVIGRTEWLYGCVRITVQPKGLRDRKIVETQTFDEPQLIVLKRFSKESPRPPSGGGPRTNENVALSRN